MKKARLGMYWQVYGYQEVELPDDIKTTEDAIDWIRFNFRDIPLPDDPDYVVGSDDFDEETVELYEV